MGRNGNADVIELSDDVQRGTEQEMAAVLPHQNGRSDQPLLRGNGKDESHNNLFC